MFHFLFHKLYFIYTTVQTIYESDYYPLIDCRSDDKMMDLIFTI